MLKRDPDKDLEMLVEALTETDDEVVSEGATTPTNEKTDTDTDTIPAFPTPRQKIIQEARKMAAANGYPTTYKTEKIPVNISLPGFLADMLEKAARNRNTTQESIIIGSLYHAGIFDTFD